MFIGGVFLLFPRHVQVLTGACYESLSSKPFLKGGGVWLSWLAPLGCTVFLFINKNFELPKKRAVLTSKSDIGNLIIVDVYLT